MKRSIAVTIFVTFFVSNFTLPLSAELFAEEITELQTARGSFVPILLKEVTEPNIILEVDDFNHPSTYNLLGGKTQGDEEEPGGLIPSYTPSGRLTMGRVGHSLKMDYNVTVPMSIAFYWSRLGPHDLSASDPGASFPVSLEGFNYLSFWIKSDKEYPRFSIEFHQDINGDHLFTLGQDINSKISVARYILEPQTDIAGGAAEVVVDVRDHALLHEGKTPSVGGEVEVKPDTATPSLFAGGGIVTEIIRDESKVEEVKIEEPTVETPVISEAEIIQRKERARKRTSRRRSRSRVSFTQSDSSISSRDSRKSRQDRWQKKPLRKVAIEAGTTVKTTAVVSTVQGSRSGGKQVVERAPQQIVAIQKKRVGWRKVVIPLRDFRTIKDWSSILEMVFVFENRLGSDQGIIYADDIVFGSNAVSKVPAEKLKTKLQSINYVPLKEGVSPATIKGIQMVNQQKESRTIRDDLIEYPSDRYMAGIFAEAQAGSIERVKALFDFEKKVEAVDKVELPPVVLIDLYAEPVDPLMESMRVELSVDRGQTWSIIENLYGNQETGEYIFPWRVPPLKMDEPAWLRVVAVDIWGRSVELRKPVILNEGGGA